MMPTPAMLSLMRWSPSRLHGRFPQACPCGFLGQGTWRARPGTDPFGGATFLRPWMAAGDPMAMARLKVEVAVDLFRLLDVPFFTFHDCDIAPEGASLAASNRNVDARGVYAPQQC
jgi:hypothetical protein